MKTIIPKHKRGGIIEIPSTLAVPSAGKSGDLPIWPPEFAWSARYRETIHQSVWFDNDYGHALPPEIVARAKTGISNL